MALPTAYLTSTRNLEGILNAIQSGKAPPKFTQRFLEELGFKGNPDRLIINVLKSLGFLSPDGTPTQRYFEFLDQSRSGPVLAEALEEAYADLYRLHRRAHTLPRQELIGKVKTLTQGQASDAVVAKMVTTLTALADLADFDAPRGEAVGDRPGVNGDAAGDADGAAPGDTARVALHGSQAALGAPEAIRLGGFVYNVELHLPDSRDPAVYEALFRALKTHLLS